jgi:hypothetical protein
MTDELTFYQCSCSYSRDDDYTKKLFTRYKKSLKKIQPAKGENQNDNGVNPNDKVYPIDKVHPNYKEEALYLKLGHCYEKGIGTNVNKCEAFEYYKKSAEKGNVYGMANVVRFYWLYEIKPEDDNDKDTELMPEDTAPKQLYEEYKKKIFEHYQECAKNGDTYGMINLGTCYERGFGTDNNKPYTDKAFEWYLESAEKGNAIGMKEVARCYEIKNDSDKASDWSKKHDTVIQDLERYYIVKLKKRFNEWKNLKTLTNTYFIMHILFCLLVLMISIALIVVEKRNMQPKVRDITKIVFSGTIGAVSGLASLFQLKDLFSRFKSGSMDELYNKEKELNTNRYEVNWIFRIQEANQFIEFEKKNEKRRQLYFMKKVNRHIKTLLFAASVWIFIFSLFLIGLTLLSIFFLFGEDAKSKFDDVFQAYHIDFKINVNIVTITYAAINVFYSTILYSFFLKHFVPRRVEEEGSFFYKDKISLYKFAWKKRWILILNVPSIVLLLLIGLISFKSLKSGKIKMRRIELTMTEIEGIKRLFFGASADIEQEV